MVKTKPDYIGLDDDIDCERCGIMFPTRKAVWLSPKGKDKWTFDSFSNVYPSPFCPHCMKKIKIVDN